MNGSPAALLRLAIFGVLGAIAAAGVAGALLGFDPLDSALHLPGCLFYALSGIPCPGCGMTRALLLLGQLRVGDALAAHPLSPALLLAMAWTLTGSPGRDWLEHKAFAGTLLAAVLGVWVARLATGSAI
jgi:hypothetical protein